MSRFVTDGVPDLLVRLWRHLRRRRRRQFFLLLVLMVVAAVAEVATLGAVLPFIGILTAPDRVWSNSLVQDFAGFLGITSPEGLILPLTILFGLAAVVAGAVRLLLLWTETRLAHATGADLGIEAYRRTLYQPYAVHVTRSSGEVIAGIFKVGTVVNGALVPVPRLISSSILVAMITLALILVDPVVALIGLFGSAGAYLMISRVSRHRLHRNSDRIAVEQTKVVKAVQDGLGGIRDVLLNGTQQVFSDIFSRSDVSLLRAQGDNIFIGLSPRFLLESLAMVLIAGLAYVMRLRDGGVAGALPVLAALALGAQRLIPALQQIFHSWSRMAGSRGSMIDVVGLLDQPIPAAALDPEPLPLELQTAIGLERVRFRYTVDGPWVLDGVDLTIPKGFRVGFVGATGSGKSTILDLLMGLLDPSEGRVTVDGRSIGGERRRAWQRSISHVPQTIFLSDTTWAENIAFGVRSDAVDMDRVRASARQAQLEDVIETHPDGYQARIGERGVRLSGGQRQRIGIARALYKQAGILVLDEATSALDNVTERSVMGSIAALDVDFTILIVAHRLTTVQQCDVIFELRDARIVAQGSYDELLEISPSFRLMALDSE